ncbi:MAG: helix-turn-helix transcriptional regulator [Chitinophagaceae bacterium]|nr:helix-turn-helix transcriptional regulator [Chitinophagaceae bacterium]
MNKDEKKIKIIFEGAKKARQSFCPIRDIIERVNDKWSMLTILALGGYGKQRFNAIRKLIPDISQRMLTVTLRNLENDGLITRQVFAEVPPRVEYALTDLGDSLMNQLLIFADWANTNSDKILKKRKRC